MGRRADAGTETQDCVRRLRNRRSSRRLYRMRYAYEDGLVRIPPDEALKLAPMASR